MVMPENILVSQKEIEACKEEYFTQHTYSGTDEPVIIDDHTAEIIVRSRKRHRNYLNSVHKSHEMTEWGTEILAPAGTARFYVHRQCVNCGGEQYHHSAGKFIDSELEEKCPMLEEV